jgi:hypothetical protein
MKVKGVLCFLLIAISSWPLASCKTVIQTSATQSSEVLTSSLEQSTKTDESSSNTSSGDFSPPIIKSVELLDDKGNTLAQADGWIQLKPQSKIRVNFEGKATKVDFYTMPTGTETYLLQQCIGTVDLTEQDSYAELNWKVPNSFMGYIFVLVYNGNVARSSDQFFIKAIYNG